MATKTKIDMDRVLEAVEADENTGFCLACGAEHGGIEPDARRYLCDECDAPKVYGAEQILLMLGGI